MKRENPVVMVIDNNSELNIEAGLQQFGYRVITRHNLSQALEDVTDFTIRCRPDLILLKTDQVPAEETWMLSALREAAQRPGLPIICLGKSGETSPLRVTHLPELNAQVKQSKITQLTTLINSLLPNKTMAAAGSVN